MHDQRSMPITWGDITAHPESMPMHERFGNDQRLMRIIGVELKARSMDGLQTELEMFVPSRGLVVPRHRQFNPAAFHSSDYIESFPITIHTNIGDINLQGY